MSKYFTERGYAVEIGANVLAQHGFMAGLADVRARDLNHMLRDPRIRMVMTSTGGKSAAHLLPLIDYSAMARDPKILVGLSDPSIVLNAVTAVAGVVTFHGPNGHSFGHKGISQFSEQHFWPIVAEALRIPYVYPLGDTIRVLKGGAVVEGVLYGGHLGTNQALIGTRWCPQWNESVLFIEEIGVELNRIDAMLCHLRLAGVLASIKALIVGQSVGCKETTYPEVESLEEIVMRHSSEYTFPILSNVPVGHTEDKLTMPIGCRVRIDTSVPSIELIESPTA